jgi:hypothetical protein
MLQPLFVASRMTTEDRAGEEIFFSPLRGETGERVKVSGFTLNIIFHL